MDVMSENNTGPGDDFNREIAAESELGGEGLTEDDLLAEDIFDVWLEFGWFSLLPTAVFSITEATDGLRFSREDFFDAVALNISEHGYTELDGDPLWLVANLETAQELELAEPGEYDEYVEGERQQRANWQELTAREPSLAVQSLDGLLELLIRLELIESAERDGVELLELADEVPDPVGLLPLSDDEQQEMLEKRPTEEPDPVLQSLHQFLFHSEDTDLATSIGRLSKQAMVDPEQTKILLAALVFGDAYGLTVERFAPLAMEEILTLAEHQKFTIKVDRSAEGLQEHGH